MLRTVVPALLALALAPCAFAGNVFKCKTADGSFVYQQRACDTSEKQVDRIGFSNEPAPAPEIRSSVDAWNPQTAPNRPAPAYRSEDPWAVPDKGETVAYECRGNGRVWTQPGPCTLGSYQSRTMDKKELCKELRAPRDDGGDGAGRRTYNRNKARDRHC